MRPESFARWPLGVGRRDADFAVRLGVEGDVEFCLGLVAAIGAGDEAAWRQTLTRTVRDGVERALFVAEAARQLASATSVRSYEISAALPPLPISAGWHARYDADPEHR